MKCKNGRDGVKAVCSDRPDKYTVKAFGVFDKKGGLRRWKEGRLAVYLSARGEDIDFMRSKNKKENFVVKKIVISII